MDRTKNSATPRTHSAAPAATTAGSGLTNVTARRTPPVAAIQNGIVFTA
jgi:hypothetical protein